MVIVKNTMETCVVMLVSVARNVRFVAVAVLPALRWRAKNLKHVDIKRVYFIKYVTSDVSRLSKV